MHIADQVLWAYMPRSGIVGSYDIFSFGFLKNRHTDFQNGYTNMHSYQK